MQWRKRGERKKSQHKFDGGLSQLTPNLIVPSLSKPDKITSAYIEEIGSEVDLIDFTTELGVNTP